LRSELRRSYARPVPCHLTHAFSCKSVTTLFGKGCDQAWWIKYSCNLFLSHVRRIQPALGSRGRGSFSQMPKSAYGASPKIPLCYLASIDLACFFFSFSMAWGIARLADIKSHFLLLQTTECPRHQRHRITIEHELCHVFASLHTLGGPLSQILASMLHGPIPISAAAETDRSLPQ